MKTALNPEVLGKISKSRLRSELQLTCAEPRVSPALKLLDSCGALKAMFDMQADETMLKQLDAQRREHPIPDESYLLALLLSVPDKHLLRHSNMFSWPKRFLEARKFLLRARQADQIDEDRLADSSEAVRAVLKTLSPALRSQVEHFELVPQRRKLRGRDVLDLGLSPGPQVGQVLAKVAKARADGQTTSFEAELKLAKALIEKLALQANTPQE
jgi:tRNA nucleotidyltransferase (CCA-adding enzyme)